MTHPRVEQLRFARSEFLRGLQGVRADLAERPVGQMNSIAWAVGHMAWHEQLSWLTRGQGITPRPDLNDLAASGGGPSTPPYEAMLAAWHEVVAAADPWLDALDTSRLAQPMGRTQTFGTGLLRVTYHYFVHAGEISAIRQLQEGGRLPEFIGDIQREAPWRPEPPA